VNSSNTITRPSRETLSAMVAGDVFIPGDDGYDQARRAWDLAAEQRPAVVVFAESVVDVVRAVRFAASEGMRVAPQGTGHGALPLELLDGAMLLKTSRMRRVEIYPATRTARAEAGAQWEDVTVPAGGYGLAALAGTSPNVGVTGYTLGGGIGWLARRYGLAANSVTAVEVVTPDGRLARADSEHEPDLLWAVRGGGGSVGVVTALEMAVYPVGELYAGALFFPIERGSELLHAWREWTGTVPDEVTSLGRILRLPPIPEIPELLRGRAFALVEAAYLGDARSGAELLRPLRELGAELDTFATIAAPALAQLNMDPEQPIPSVGDGAFLIDAPADAIDTVVALVGADVDTPLQSIELRHLGGALARESPVAGAQPKIDAKYLIFAGGFAPSSEVGDAVRAHVRALKDALTPWHAGYDYYNFAEIPAEAEVVLPPASYQRLREIKATYDRDQAIISAHPVRPARRARLCHRDREVGR
jgi:FAD/FMN-containing dehydrogenase